MNRIVIERLYQLYLDTVKRCLTDTIELPDEELEYNLFEEFDVGVNSFFHDDNLTKLNDAGIIDEQARKLSQEIRRDWNILQKRRWTQHEIRSDPDWLKLFNACENLLKLLPVEK